MFWELWSNRVHLTLSDHGRKCLQTLCKKGATPCVNLKTKDGVKPKTEVLKLSQKVEDLSSKMASSALINMMPGPSCRTQFLPRVNFSLAECNLHCMQKYWSNQHFVSSLKFCS